MYRTQVNDVLLAALGRVLAGGPARPGRGRPRGPRPRGAADGVDLSRTVGWFTTLFPVALRCGGGDWGSRAEVGQGAAARGTAPRPRLRRPALPRPAGWRQPAAGRPQSASTTSASSTGWAADGGLYHGSAAELELDEDPAGGPYRTCSTSSARSRSDPGVHLVLLGEPARRGHRRRAGRGLVAALREIIAHCARPGAGGRTPSDFPLAGSTSPRWTGWSATAVRSRTSTRSRRRRPAWCSTGSPRTTRASTSSR